ncbi:MAG: LysM peptidoglycan-binding domain-containing protein [Breznakibacter sp.]
MVKYKIKWLVVLFWLSASSIVWAQIPANTAKVVVEGREYYRYVVEKGIGLYRISVNFNVSQDEIVKINPSVTNGLVEGQVLLIPIPSVKPVPIPPNSHLVEKGQTLYSIANQYGVTIESILEKNPFLQDGLKEGTVIQIPLSSETSSLKQEKQPLKKYGFHTVQPKETLYGIAKMHGLTVEELVALNPGVRDAGLREGSVLRYIPQSETVSVEGSEIAQPGPEVTGYKLVHVHKIGAGDNLHAIARKYKVAYADLLNANEGIDAEKLTVGTSLIIPVSPLANNELMESDMYRSHKVGKKESLYALTKRYSVSTDLVRLFNPQLDLNDLKKGQQLYFPTSEWVFGYAEATSRKKEATFEKEFVLEDNNCNGYNYFQSRETINVAVLLPFNVALNSISMVTDTMSHVSGTTDAGVERMTIGGHTKMILEFYEGFLMGIEKWKRKGVNIRLMAFDTGSEASDIQKLLRRPELSLADIIVGPAYPDHVKIVSEFSKQHKIKMVNPFSASSSEIRNNPNFFLASPIDSMGVNPMAKYMVDKAQGANIIILKSATSSPVEATVVQAVKSYYQQKGGIAYAQLKEIIFSKESHASIMSGMVHEANNIIIIPSENEVFVGQVVIALDAIAERNQYSMEVYGQPEWLKFQTIDPESLHKLNCRAFSTYGFDYTNNDTKQFIHDFRLLYNSEPVAFSPYFQRVSAGSGYNRYGAWGHDVAYFFVGAMVKYGKSFEGCVAKMDSRGLVQSNFIFKRISNWGGFYSAGLFVIEFNKDFSVVRTAID